MNSFEKELVKIEKEYINAPKDLLLERIAETGRQVVVFGTGTIGYAVAGMINEQFPGQLVAFCDSFKTSHNTKLNIPIINPTQLQKDFKDAIVVIACSYRYSDEIFDMLMQLGFQPKDVFRKYGHQKEYTLEQIRPHLKGYAWVYDFFKDDISKKIIVDRIRGYLFPFEMCHSSCSDEYFEPNIIKLSEKEVFVDGGCYTGDTALEFIRRTDGRYAHIFGFEPEVENYKKSKVELDVYPNISLVNKGLWSDDILLPFCSNSGASRIDTEGKTSVPVVSLDHFFADKSDGQLPTFIKMDIEGAEKNALLGAKNVIQSTHPKLAICAYHKPEDIYELPQIINQYGEYDFYLRHYSKVWKGTVIYAVAKNNNDVSRADEALQTGGLGQ